MEKSRSTAALRSYTCHPRGRLSMGGSRSEADVEADNNGHVTVALHITMRVIISQRERRQFVAVTIRVDDARTVYTVGHPAADVYFEAYVREISNE